MKIYFDEQIFINNIFKYKVFFIVYIIIQEKKNRT